ncbi:hypothetical protein PV755_46305 [Streptomyces caniscabiei]|uniref:Uncharacterized protein n=1 Tax=Streptomyces caniscabiei TaxID=2746961 RepID=A0A927QFE0_9ACTN|nr:hypothetical protein [Streptomyces caniscabiei]MBD9723495.1 hypothetical protein [Streptomyces caniscabiei]MDX3516218.1 hypothetical protein [Streptomyces caniscabiei]MDX3725278.1 hypothetical protein [Streptomyces caniscabiei]WEO27066.1 hypothetical protein IHE65_30065 [Streptomyces caniscabiei]
MTTRTRQAPHHRNLTCYTDYRCRLPECVTRYNHWQRNRLRAVADGTWQPFIDATPVREHLLHLYAAGLTPHRVSVLTGIDFNTIRLYTQPAPKQGRGMTRQTTPAFQAKILAVRAEPTLPGRVDPTGTRRRIQALSAIGWPLRELGPHIGIRPDNVRRILTRGQTVYGTTAKATIDAYEKLRRSRPRRHGISEIGTARALRNARQQRWAPPKYWDQHPGAIDDPHFEPMYGVTRREQIAQDANWIMTTVGLSRAETAARLGVDKSYIEHAFRDHPQYAVEVAA